MRLPISVFLPALWAASYVVGKGPPGLKPGPRRCDRYCPPGVSCPANDGCFIQGRANMSAEAEERCSSTVESVIAAEQTSCAASISAEQTSCISAQQSSCAASISAEQTSCASSISAQQTSCATSISAQQTSCAASISAVQTNCISAQQSSCTASISSAIGSYSSALASYSSALTQCQAAAASAGQKCGVIGWSRSYYQTLAGVDLAGCKARCLADSRCLSYSANVVLSNFPAAGIFPHACYLYGQAAKDVPTVYHSAFAMYDRICP